MGVQKYLKEVVHETYKIGYHYENYATLRGRLQHLATGVLLIEDPDKSVPERTIHLVGSQDNVNSVIEMLDFVMGKRKFCFFTCAIDNEVKQVHLGTVTSLVTRSIQEKFPDVRWWLLGNELRFSGPESQASAALRYVY